MASGIWQHCCPIIRRASEGLRMVAKPGASGGKRAGAGRKSGAAWASSRDPSLRAAGRALAKDMVSGRRKHPLEALLDLAESEATPVPERIRAYVGALPFVMPRLSMAVVADVTPKGGPADVNPAAQLERMVEALNRLSSAQSQAIETTAQRDENEA